MTETLSRFLSVLVLALGIPWAGGAAEVIQLKWSTIHGAPPGKLPPRQEEFLPAFRLSLVTLPESAIVGIALSQSGLLGLSAGQSETLLPLAAERYRLMATSAEYARAPSQLFYCFAETKPTTGSANVYLPDRPSKDSPVIVFLHGSGGSFLWYQHWLSETFPEAIVIAPAYGWGPVDIPVRYLTEAVIATSTRLGFPLQVPTLMGLSAGGLGGCRAYVLEPASFRRLICLGAFPPSDTLRRFPPGGEVHFVAGAKEAFVGSGQLGASVRKIRETVPRCGVFVIPQAYHFFLLTHPEPARDALRRIFALEQPGPAR
jgi:pimeloyl-ACP methyl ester carboxylesterase